MFDFDHLAPVKTAKLKLPSIIRWPRTSPHVIELELQHAGDGNPGYAAARLKTPVPSDRLAAYERIAKLFGEHVIVGWTGVLDDKGAPLPFSKAGATELLMALVRAKRHDILDWLHAFATDAENFHDPVALAEDVGKG